MKILTRDDTEHDVEYVLASEARAIKENHDELLAKVNSLEFRLALEKHLNTDHEQDYLAVWKLIKRPDETVVQAAQRLKSENEAMHTELDELKSGSIHSCSDSCQRPGCIRRRENEAMRAAIKEAHRILRDILHNYECGPVIDNNCEHTLAKLAPYLP